MLAMFFFMGISMVYIGDQVGKSRSCVNTCDTVLMEKQPNG